MKYLLLLIIVSVSSPAFSAQYDLNDRMKTLGELSEIHKKNIMQMEPKLRYFYVASGSLLACGKSAEAKIIDDSAIDFLDESYFTNIDLKAADTTKRNQALKDEQLAIIYYYSIVMGYNSAVTASLDTPEQKDAFCQKASAAFDEYNTKKKPRRRR